MASYGTFANRLVDSIPRIMLKIDVEKLSVNEDLNVVRKLIYGTDPYIYHDLFGSFEVADIVLERLMRDSKSIFHWGNYYVAKENNDIRGIAALHGLKFKWDRNEIIRHFPAGFAPPDSFSAVSEYFEDVFRGDRDGMSACNVSVMKEHRRQGVGDELVKHLIKESGMQDIYLSVISSNKAAVELYRKNKFKVREEIYEYGGYGQPPVRCFRMMYSHRSNE